jgi:hypothetical protein
MNGFIKRRGSRRAKLPQFRRKNSSRKADKNFNIKGTKERVKVKKSDLSAFCNGTINLGNRSNAPRKSPPEC